MRKHIRVSDTSAKEINANKIKHKTFATHRTAYNDPRDEVDILALRSLQEDINDAVVDNVSYQDYINKVDFSMEKHWSFLTPDQKIDVIDDIMNGLKSLSEEKTGSQHAGSVIVLDPNIANAHEKANASIMVGTPIYSHDESDVPGYSRIKIGERINIQINFDTGELDFYHRSEIHGSDDRISSSELNTILNARDQLIINLKPRNTKQSSLDDGFGEGGSAVRNQSPPEEEDIEQQSMEIDQSIAINKNDPRFKRVRNVAPSIRSRVKKTDHIAPSIRRKEAREENIIDVINQMKADQIEIEEEEKVDQKLPELTDVRQRIVNKKDTKLVRIKGKTSRVEELRS